MVISLEVQISAVRWSAPNQGAIVVGICLREKLSHADALANGLEAVSIRLLGTALGRERVLPGDTWHVEGCLETYRGSAQIRGDRATLIQPAPRVMVDTLAGPRFPGVGRVKARALVDAFGEGLGSLLTIGDLDSLTRVVPLELAKTLIEGWRDLCPSDVIQWLDRHRFPVRIARRLVDFYGPAAAKKLQDDPYRLLAFGEPWARVDQIAQEGLGLEADDPRREHAAVTEALFEAYDREGSTALKRGALLSQVARLLNGPDSQAVHSVSSCPPDGGWVHDPERDLFQSRGAWFMERWASNRLLQMMGVGQPGRQTDAFRWAAAEFPPHVRELTRQVLSDWDAVNEPLGEEQRLAVEIALAQPVAVISGGAGVGKTTVLKALYAVLDRLGMPLVQMALAGRAARRMRDTTGRPALTIAAFLNQVPRPEPEGCTYVVDEASMLGIATLYRILRRVTPGGRLLLVGDDMQLPPVEAGLTFHQFCRAGSKMPRVHMSRVYRQAGLTGIPQIASAIRSGEWPLIPEFTGPTDGVAVLHCGPDRQAAAIASVYEHLVGAEGREEEVQVLSVLTGARRETPASVAGINKDLYRRRLQGRRPVLLAGEHSGFCEGCPVMFLENDRARGLSNGSIGRITHAQRGLDAPDHVVCWATLDGEEHRLTRDDFAAGRIVRAFSMTVHKAQGSQWNRVILAISPSVLLDRTLVYTAVTRAVRQVVLIGDLAAAAEAVEHLPRAHERIVGFDL